MKKSETSETTNPNPKINIDTRREMILDQHEKLLPELSKARAKAKIARLEHEANDHTSFYWKEYKEAHEAAITKVLFLKNKIKELEKQSNFLDQVDAVITEPTKLNFVALTLANVVEKIKLPPVVRKKRRNIQPKKDTTLGSRQIAKRKQREATKQGQQ